MVVDYIYNYTTNSIKDLSDVLVPGYNEDVLKRLRR